MRCLQKRKLISVDMPPHNVHMRICARIIAKNLYRDETPYRSLATSKSILITNTSFCGSALEIPVAQKN